MPDNDNNASMGEFTTPKSVVDYGPDHGPGPGHGFRGHRMGVVFVDRSKLEGAGQPAMAGKFVSSPFAESLGYDIGKTFKETYDETYEVVKKKRKWFSKPLLGIWTTLCAIPRHLLRNSMASTEYNPGNVEQMERDFGNKL